MKAQAKDPLYARYLVYLTRPFPDFDFSFIKPVRRRAVELLGLRDGDRILDAGCGSGGSFPFLRNSVGKTGEVIGVEISPRTVVNTRRRIASNAWTNVSVIEGDARTVKLNGKFNALLMFAAPDVYASEEALSNIFPHLTENARVVIFGARISERRFGWILNGFLRAALSTLSFSSTPKLQSEPWTILKKRLTEVKVEEYFFGWMFLAWGHVSSLEKKELLHNVTHLVVTFSVTWCAMDLATHTHTQKSDLPDIQDSQSKMPFHCLPVCQSSNDIFRIQDLHTTDSNYPCGRLLPSTYCHIFYNISPKAS